MANAKRDENRVPTLLAVSEIDDSTPVRIWGDPVTRELLVKTAAGSSSDNSIVDGVDSNIRATVRDLTNSNPLATQIVDASGDAITSFGGGTQYAVSDVAGGTDTGTLSLVVRDDALTTLTPADGDYTQMRVNSTGRLWTTSVLEAGDNAVGRVKLTDGTDVADILDLTNSNPLTVAIVDGSGDQISSFGGGTQYAVDTALGSTPTGTLSLAKRDDVLTTLTPVDGDAVENRVDQWGSLWVSLGTRLDSTNDSISAVQSGTWNINNVSGTVSLPTGASTAANQTTANGLLTTIETNTDFGTVTGGGTETGALRVTVANNSTGVLSVDDNGGSLTVDGSVTVINSFGASAVNIQDGGNSITVDGTVAVSSISTSITPGTAAANLGKAEDAVHTSGDVGVMTLGVRNDGMATSFSGTNGDYTPIATDAQGRISVVQRAPTATLSNVASSATSVTLLASNTARIGAMLYNDSTQNCYVKFGTTASTSSFTVILTTNTYYEVPGGYTGRIDGIWVSANGNMRVTELT